MYLQRPMVSMQLEMMLLYQAEEALLLLWPTNFRHLSLPTVCPLMVGPSTYTLMAYLSDRWAC
jgi:hypothetical protein